MGLRCSVLGHRYGARERIEERDQDGDEVVVTVRDVKTCDRCGHERVVSESKEVTAAPGANVTAQAPQAEASAEEEQTGAVDPPVEEGDDDAVIIEDDEESGPRDPGEWPDEPEPPVDDEGSENPEDDAWPEVDEEADEGYDAVSGNEEEPEVDEVIEAAVVAEPETDVAGEETETGFFKADDIDAPADPSEGDVRSEYYCPQCSWHRESLEASVRAGDICPDCRTGYIAERDPA